MSQSEPPCPSAAADPNLGGEAAVAEGLTDRSSDDTSGGWWPLDEPVGSTGALTLCGSCPAAEAAKRRLAPAPEALSMSRVGVAGMLWLCWGGPVGRPPSADAAPPGAAPAPCALPKCPAPLDRVLSVRLPVRTWLNGVALKLAPAPPPPARRPKPAAPSGNSPLLWML